MSNRFFQGVVYQLKDSIDRTVGVLDEYGTVIACSDLIKIGEKRDHVVPSITATMDIVKDDSYTYKPVNNGPGLEYIAFIEGNDEISDKFISLVVIALANIKQYYDEKF